LWARLLPILTVYLGWFTRLFLPDYFRVLGIPLLRGRLFDDRDQTGKENVVIINESIAQRFFSGEDPIGKHLDDLGDRFGKERHYCTIIGVAANVVHDNPESQETPFQAYYPYTQTAGGFGDAPKFETLVLHATGDAQSAIASLRKTVAAIDPDLPLSNVGRYDDLIAKSFATKRLALVVLGLFSGAALLLAAIGLYAVLSYSVSQRIREIGVRMALGAKPASILNLITRQGLKLVCFGLIIGILAGLTLGQFLGSLLYGVSVADPVALGTSVLVLAVAALLACLLPALRATRINPITALRE
jgi:predicted permease